MKKLNKWMIRLLLIAVLSFNALAGSLDPYVRGLETRYSFNFDTISNEAIQLTKSIIEKTFISEKEKKENILYVGIGRSPFILVDILELNGFPIVKIPISSFRFAKSPLAANQAEQLGWYGIVSDFDVEDQKIFSAYLRDSVEQNYYKNPTSNKFETGSNSKITKVVFIDYSSRLGISLFSFAQFALPSFRALFPSASFELSLLLNTEDNFLDPVIDERIKKNFNAFQINKQTEKVSLNIFDIGSREQSRDNPNSQNINKPKGFGHLIWHPHSHIEDFAPFGRVDFYATIYEYYTKNNLVGIHQEFKNDSDQTLYRLLYNYLYSKVSAYEESNDQKKFPFMLPELPLFESILQQKWCNSKLTPKENEK